MSPLHASLALSLEETLRGGVTPPAWRSAPDCTELLAEWPQATRLLLQLLSRLPACDEPSFGDEEAYEEPELEELPVLE